MPKRKKNEGSELLAKLNSGMEPAPAKSAQQTEAPEPQLKTEAVATSNDLQSLIDDGKVNVKKKKERRKRTEPQKDAPKTIVKIENPENQVQDYQKIDEEAIAAAIAHEKQAKKRETLAVRVKQISAIFMILLCGYLVFLIYGLWNTEYVYDDNGTIVPRVMTVEKIRALADYNDICGFYLQARTAYEEILVLDYRVSAGLENIVLIGPEYLAEVDRLNDLYIQTQGLDAATEYAQLQAMILYWLENDAAPYCGNLSQAIAYNDSNSLSLALELQTASYNDFSAMTAMLIALAENVDGADVDAISNWSPESYIRNHIGDLTYAGE